MLMTPTRAPALSVTTIEADAAGGQHLGRLGNGGLG